MQSIDDILRQADEIERLIGYTFSKKELLVLAFIHRSFFNEHRYQLDAHNERLEFLGDSVLGLLVAEYLYIRMPTEAEGRLSLLRSQIVEASSCARLARQLGVDAYLLLGRGERMNAGRGKETIVADLFEALIGAIYLDGGWEAAKQFFWRHFEGEIAAHLLQPTRNWKAELQDYAQKKHQRPPVYKVVHEEGPEHGKTFHVVAYVGDVPVGEGTGSSKKEAEQAAAEKAFHLWESTSDG